MDSKHTPGPWEQTDGHGPTPHGTAVAQVGGNQYLIASCTAYFGREGGQANARLIAAAPELLAALEQAHMALIGYLPAHRNVVTDAAIEAARAAIAKATGQ